MIFSPRNVVLTVSFLSFGLNLACTREVVIRETASEEKTEGQVAPVVYGVVLGPADAVQCATGGSLIEIFVDANVDGLRSEGEAVVSSSAVCHGSNGAAGADGAISPFNIVDAIFPCGDTGNFKEVLLRLQNGSVLSSFSNTSGGDMTRLVLLPDGTYMNTDNSGCVFTLASSVENQSRSISWGGVVQSTWSVH